jgi:hypothetical protein
VKRSDIPPFIGKPAGGRRETAARLWLGPPVILASVACYVLMAVTGLRLIFIGIALGIVAAFAFAVHGARRRDYQAIRDADFKVCMRCRYPLDAIAPEGDCPECGAPYSHEESVKCWRFAYSGFVRKEMRRA